MKLMELQTTPHPFLTMLRETRLLLRRKLRPLTQTSPRRLPLPRRTTPRRKTFRPLRMLRRILRTILRPFRLMLRLLRKLRRLWWRMRRLLRILFR